MSVAAFVGSTGLGRTHMALSAALSDYALEMDGIRSKLTCAFQLERCVSSAWLPMVRLSTISKPCQA